MYFNLIHKIKNNDELEAIKYQQDIAHEYGIKTTLHLAYESMFDEETVAYCKNQHEEFGDEIGCNMQAVIGPHTAECLGSRQIEIHLYTFEEQKKFVETAFEKFKSLFGFYPTSCSFYYISAPILNWIKEKYPQFKIAVINCFEEGVHMFAGNKNAWHLLCEGSPWGAYYPSKDNSMCPAKSKDDWNGIIGVPHLNRDMLMAYIGRDDCFSSHSANVQRGMVNNGKDCKYLYDFFDLWQEQEKYNDVVYYNTIVGPKWLMDGKNFEESMDDSRDLYRQTISIYRDKMAKGELVACTMSEYADIHIQKCSFDTVDINLWKDILCGSNRQLFWFVHQNYRITIDPNLGGAIVDLRPYAGRLNIVPGPYEKPQWDGSYPYALQFWHRKSYHTCTIDDADLWQYRSECSVKKLDNGDVLLTLDPVEVYTSDAEAVVQTTFLFKHDGPIKVTRKILSASNNEKEFVIKETFKGCWGTNTLPEDYRGTKLYIDEHDGRRELIADYADKRLMSDNAKNAGCFVPQLNTNFDFAGVGDNISYMVDEGHMFEPYYVITTSHNRIKAGEEASTWIQIG